MPLFSLLLNLLWIVFGGLWMALAWLVAAVLMAITIVGLPWARAALTIARYTLLPFGQRAVSRAEYTGREDLGTGPLGTLGNLIWLVFAGWWLALGHLFFAIAHAVTIIGQSAKPASFRCAQAKGRPMMVMAWPSAKRMWPRASHQPAKMNQMMLPRVPSGPVPRSPRPV